MLTLIKKLNQYIKENKPLVFSLTFAVLYTSVTFAAPYLSSDAILNPTCAPGDVDCYVSLYPDQTGNSGKFLTTNGTSTSWNTITTTQAIGDSITNATAGSILFAGSGGTFAQDNSNFFWDDTNNRLGIGTASPQTDLHLYTSNAGWDISMILESNSGNATQIFKSGANSTNAKVFQIVNAADSFMFRGRLDDFGNPYGDGLMGSGNFYRAIKNLTNGRVNYQAWGIDGVEALTLDTSANLGVGTNTPGAKLHVYGGAYSSVLADVSDSTFAKIWLGAGINATNSGYIGYDEGGNERLVLNSGYSASHIEFRIEDIEKVRIDSSGNVGIGTTNPVSKLQINNGTGISQLGAGSSGADIILSTGGAIYTSGVWSSQFGPRGGGETLTFSDWDAVPLMTIITATGGTKGNIGIGTTSPGNKLEIYDATSPTIKLNNGTYSATLSQGSSYETTLAASSYLKLTTTGGANYLLSGTKNYSWNDTGISGDNTAFAMYAGHAGSFGFTTVGATSVYNAIQPVYTDNSTGGLKFNYKTGGTDTEGFRLASNGKVGIGTDMASTNNYGLLNVNGRITAETEFLIDRTAGNTSAYMTGFVRESGATGAFSTGITGQGELSTYGLGAFVLGTSDAKPLIFGTSGVERIRILSDGSVGIGTTTPGQKLDVQGFINANSGFITPVSGGGLYLSAATAGVYTGSNIVTLGNWNDATKGVTVNTSTGNVGIGTTTPGRTLDVSYTETTATRSISYLRLTAKHALGAYHGTSVFESYYHDLGNGIQFTPAQIKMEGLSSGGGGVNSTGEIGFFTKSDTGVLSALPTEKMRITAAGDIGIGTTSPTHKLDVNGTINTGGGYANFTTYNDNGSNGVAYVGEEVKAGIATSRSNPFTYAGVTIPGFSSALILGTSYGYDVGTGNYIISVGDLNIRVNNTTTALYANTSGNVAIGNSSPSYKLHVGSSSVSGIVARFENSTGTCDINPTTTSLSCSSDINLKKNITTLDGTDFILNIDSEIQYATNLDKLLALNVVTYNWNTEDDNTTKHIGFIAQQVESVYPDLVTTDINTNLKSLNITNLTPYIVKGIQELDKKITSIETLEENSNFINTLRNWLASASNGISKIFANKVQTNELCVGEVCVTESQFLQLIQNSQTSYQSAPPEDNTSNQNTEDENIQEDETLEETPEESIDEQPIEEPPMDEVIDQEDTVPAPTINPDSTQDPLPPQE